jgi:CHAT domain-containing protein
VVTHKKSSKSLLMLRLRRYFVLAGAHSLVISLWEVPDQQTQELM